MDFQHDDKKLADLIGLTLFLESVDGDFHFIEDRIRLLEERNNNPEFAKKVLKAITIRQFQFEGKDMTDSSSLSIILTQTFQQIVNGIEAENRLPFFISYLSLLKSLDLERERAYEASQKLAFVSNIQDVDLSDSFSFIFDSSADLYDKNRMVVVSGSEESEDLQLEGLWIEKNHPGEDDKAHQIFRQNLLGKIYFLYFPGFNILIFRYNGDSQLYVDGKVICKDQIYFFDFVSKIKGNDIEVVKYNHIIEKLISGVPSRKLLFVGKEVKCNMLSQLHSFSFCEEAGNFTGVFCADRKYLNELAKVMSGVRKPHQGSVLLNGFNVNQEASKIQGLIGYYPGEEMLNESLSVYDNLFYFARMVFADYSMNGIQRTVEETIRDFNLGTFRNVIAGKQKSSQLSILQRRLLLLAQQCMLNAPVLLLNHLFDDLSTEDMAVLLRNLKRIALKGKLVMVFSDKLYKEYTTVFDRIWIIDSNGSLLYQGKTEDCPVLHMENSEPIESSSFTYLENLQAKLRQMDEVELSYDCAGENEICQKRPLPRNNVSLPSIEKQLFIAFQRDWKTFANQGKLLLCAFLIPLISGVLLGAIFKQRSTGSVNLPLLFFLSVLLVFGYSLFNSLFVFHKERSLINWNHFFHLSFFMHLFAKMFLYFLCCAFQILLFLATLFLFTGINDLFLHYWLILFSLACMSTILGFVLSSFIENKAILVVAAIMLLLLQMLGGGYFFEDIYFSRKTTSVFADLAPSRWIYEALMVDQFGKNDYAKSVFAYDRKLSEASFNTTYLIPALQKELKIVSSSNTSNTATNEALSTLVVGIKKLQDTSLLFNFEYLDKLKKGIVTPEITSETTDYLIYLKLFYDLRFNQLNQKKDSALQYLSDSLGIEKVHQMKEAHVNQYVTNILTSIKNNKPYFIDGVDIVQNYDNIYRLPDNNFGRAHMFASLKKINGEYVDTYWFNLSAIWLMLLCVFFLLSFDVFYKLRFLVKKVFINLFRI
jgi:ABC transport system ATP-binding/permease protein